MPLQELSCACPVHWSGGYGYGYARKPSQKSQSLFHQRGWHCTLLVVKFECHLMWRMWRCLAEPSVIKNTTAGCATTSPLFYSLLRKRLLAIRDLLFTASKTISLLPHPPLHLFYFLTAPSDQLSLYIFTSFYSINVSVFLHVVCKQPVVVRLIEVEWAKVTLPRNPFIFRASRGLGEGGE
jgi:hypothetical protein